MEAYAIAAPTLRRYSFGLPLAIAQAEAGPPDGGPLYKCDTPNIHLVQRLLYDKSLHFPVSVVNTHLLA